MPDENFQSELEYRRSLDQLAVSMLRIEGYILEFQAKYRQLEELRRERIRSWEAANRGREEDRWPSDKLA
jgi:hypothetical protein